MNLAATGADTTATPILIGTGSIGRDNGIIAPVAITPSNLDSKGSLDQITGGTDQVSVPLGTVYY